MGTAQQERIDIRVFLHDLVDVFPDEPVGAVVLGFAAFHDRHPHWTGLLGDCYVGVYLGYLHTVTVAVYGSRRCKQAHVTALGYVADILHGWADHPQHTAVGPPLRQNVLLDGPQGLGRRGVTGQYHQRTSLEEQMLHGLACEIVHNVETAGAVGRTGVVAQIQEIIFRQLAAELFQYCQAPVPGVEYTDHDYRRSNVLCKTTNKKARQ